MSETAQTPLDLQISDAPGIVLRFAEWWDPNSRFVVVRYAVDGALEALGLRLDLDKRAFLDSTGDQAVDARIEQQIPKITRQIEAAKARSKADHRIAIA